LINRVNAHDLVRPTAFAVLVMAGQRPRSAVEAFDAIAAALPLGSVAYEAETNAKGERLIWLERVWADKLGAMRGPGESYSDVIVRIAKSEGRGR
jgi:hypothetical protein